MPGETSRTRRATVARRRRPTAGGSQLSAECIVEAAMNLLERRGPDGLSARKLGHALGADPTAIYRYFTNMDDIVLEVADRLIGDVIADFEPDADWRVALRDLAYRSHAVCIAHPQVAQVAFCRVTRRPHEMAIVETMLRILDEAGFSTAEAVLRYRALADTILSFAGQDSGVEILPSGARQGDDSAWHTVYGEVAADTHPQIAKAQQLLAEQMATSSFTIALDFLLIGFGEPQPL